MGMGMGPELDNSMPIPDEPLWFDVSASSDVILGSQHKLIVEHPLWLVVQACARMKLNNLAVVVFLENISLEYLYHVTN